MFGNDIAQSPQRRKKSFCRASRPQASGSFWFVSSVKTKTNDPPKSRLSVVAPYVHPSLALWDVLYFCPTNHHHPTTKPSIPLSLHLSSSLLSCTHYNCNMTLAISYERLTVPQIFHKAWEVFQHRFRVFLTLSLMVTLPMMLFNVAISSYAFSSLTDIMDSVNKLTEDQASIADGTYANQDTSSSGSSYNSYSGGGSTAYDPTAASDQLQADMGDIATSVMNHLPFFMMIIVFQTVVFSVLTIAGRGAMIRATAELYASVNAEPQWLQCFQLGLSRFWALFCAGVLMCFGFVILYGVPMLFFYGGYMGLALVLFLLFPPFLFYCSVRLALVFPAIVVENLSAVNGVKRSWELSRNAFCDIFCALFVAVIVVGVVANIVVKILVGSDPLAGFRPMGLALSQTIGIFVGPYMAM